MKRSTNQQQQIFKGQNMSTTQKLTISGITMAMYVVIMFLTQGFAFGQFQVRIATSLYALSAIYPFLMVPLAVSNLLSNMLMGGLGIPDILGGFAVGIITAGSVYLIRKYRLTDWLISLPIIFGPGLIVPIWLAYIINVPYSALAFSITVGQIIPGIVGVVLIKQLRDKIE